MGDFELNLFLNFGGHLFALMLLLLLIIVIEINLAPNAQRRTSNSESFREQASN